ncbi:hypothetical protein C8R47DRAFT_950499, partial [Mycena vitilis]
MAGTAHIRGPRWAHFPTLTIGLLGVQILWSVEMSYAPPYLLSLGLSKPSMAIVFLAGPLSGFFVQPLIGVLADNSTSRWGRRRPYMLAGCLICSASMLLLGYTREIAAVFTGKENASNDGLTIWLAVVAIYLVDFSINAGKVFFVQAVDRALLVDVLPPALQASGNAWAALMLGLGSMTGFFVGILDLPELLPLLGTSELQVLSVLVVLLLLAGHLATAVLIKEAVVVRKLDHQRPSFRAEMLEIWATMWRLPWVIRQIVRFYAWLGWFPVFFYTTTYISDLYARSLHVHGTSGSIGPDVAAEGTRLGARALLFSAIVALLTNLILPAFISTSSSKSNVKTGIPKIPLAALWAGSHLLFGVCMLSTFTVSSVESATWVITVMGVSGAVAQWAPFALLAEAILTSQPTTAIRDADRDPLLARADDELTSATTPDGVEFELPPGRKQDLTNRLERLDMHSPFLPGTESDRKPDIGEGLSAQAGVILVGSSASPFNTAEHFSAQGIHNVCIVIPQFLVTILCAAVFAVFD